MQLSYFARFASEPCSGDAPVADAAFLVRRLRTQLHGPQRPGRFRRTLLRRLGHDFELMDRCRLLPVRRSQAVSACVSAANDHYSLTGSENLYLRWDRIAEAAFVLLRQIFHCKMDSLQLTPGHIEIAPLLGTAGKNDGIELGPQILNSNIFSNFGARHERCALSGHLL